MMTATRADLRSIVRARAALNDARNHCAAAAHRIRDAEHNAELAEIPAVLAAAQAALESLWEALAYMDAELAAAAGEVPR